ncbi:hypothetical protein D3C71_1127990 [compost metagenome]
MLLKFGELLCPLIAELAFFFRFLLQRRKLCLHRCQLGLAQSSQVFKRGRFDLCSRRLSLALFRLGAERCRQAYRRLALCLSGSYCFLHRRDLIAHAGEDLPIARIELDPKVRSRARFYASLASGIAHLLLCEGRLHRIIGREVQRVAQRLVVRRRLQQLVPPFGLDIRKGLLEPRKVHREQRAHDRADALARADQRVIQQHQAHLGDLSSPLEH